MKSKLLIAIGILMLFAMMVSAGAIAGTAQYVDFDNPGYNTDVSVTASGQPHYWWTMMSGEGETVKAGEINGTKSLVSGKGSYAVLPMSLFENSTISYLTKITANSTGHVYVMKAGGPYAFGWVNMSSGDGCRYNLDGWGTGGPGTLTVVGPGVLQNGQVYLTEIALDSSNHITVSVYNSSFNLMGTTSSAVGSDVIPASISGLAFGNAGEPGTLVSHDNISLSETVYIPVTGVTLNKTTLSLQNGASETLVATVNPYNAANKAVTWSSSNNSVATVDSSGLVTAVGAAGASCNIKVTTTEGGFIATCQVIIVDPGTPLFIDFDNPGYNTGVSVTAAGQPVYWWTMMAGEGETVKSGEISGTKSLVSGRGSFAVLPMDLYGYSTISYLTKITADSTGHVYVMKAGTPYAFGWVNMSSGGSSYNLDGWGTGGPSTQTVVGPDVLQNGNVYLTEIVLDSSHHIKVSVYDTASNLIGTKSSAVGSDVIPSAISGLAFGNWGSAGTLVSHDNITLSETVYVPVTGVTLNKTTLTLETSTSETLVATVNPSNATNQNVTWSSDNNSVATVDSNGLVTSVGAAGTTCNITVTTVAGEFSATCQVNVVSPEGPALHYVFKDGAGATVTDITGNGNDGTIFGTPDWGEGLLNFNTGQYVECGTENDLGIVTNMTFAALVTFNPSPFPDGSTNFHLFSDQDWTSKTGQAFRIDGEKGTLTYQDCGAGIGGGLNYETLKNDTALVPGNTYHLGVVRNGTTISMYINGVLSVSGNVSMYDTNNLQFMISRDSQPWKGQMMDVQIYNRALSNANMLYLYNNPGYDIAGGHYEPPVLPSINYSDDITVDGDLADWSDAAFTAMDKAYYPDPSVNLDLTNAAYSFKWGAGGTKVYLALRVQDAEPVWNDWYTNWNSNDHIETQLWASGVSGTIDQNICDIAQQYELGLQEDGIGTWSYMCGAGDVPDFANLSYAIAQGVDGWVFYEAAMTPFTAFNRLDVNEVIARVLVVDDVIGADAVIASKNVWAEFNMIAADNKVGKSANTSAIQKRQLVREGVLGSVELQDFGASSLGIAGTATITDGTNTEIHNIVLDAAGLYSFTTALRGECTVIVKCSHWLGKAAIVTVDVTGTGVVELLSVINGDVVDNNEVDFSDINAVRAAYGSFPGDDTWNDRADVDGSGEVDFTDINIVRSKYGEIGE